MQGHWNLRQMNTLNAVLKCTYFECTSLNADTFNAHAFNAHTFNALTVLSIKSIPSHEILSQNIIAVCFLLELLASDLSCQVSCLLSLIFLSGPLSASLQIIAAFCQADRSYKTGEFEMLKSDWRIVCLSFGWSSPKERLCNLHCKHSVSRSCSRVVIPKISPKPAAPPTTSPLSECSTLEACLGPGSHSWRRGRYQVLLQPPVGVAETGKNTLFCDSAD